jgi:23S rRNA pseudouridine2605 synthase
VDKVQVDGMTIRPKTVENVYVLLNKPKGVVCTNSDREGRPRAIDLVGGVAQRVFPVGRLDVESTGLILLTNDGDLANHISHPRYGLAKTYVVEVEGHMDGASIEKMKGGMYLEGKRTGGATVKVLRRSQVRTLLEVRLTEGRNREIRRILARMKYKVRSLRRTAIGPITDRGIKTGNCRLLTAAEVQALRRQTHEHHAKDRL